MGSSEHHGLLKDFPQKITVFSHREKQTECEHKPWSPALNPHCQACVPRSRPLFPELLPQPIPKPEWEAASQPGLDSSPVTQFICTELSVKSHRPAAI